MNDRLCFVEYLENKPQRSRLLTAEKFNKIFTTLKEGQNAPCPTGLSPVMLFNYKPERQRTLDSFYLENDKLYFRTQEGPKEVVELNSVFDIIVSTHGNLLHSGMNKTFDDIKDRIHGVTLKDVKKLIRTHKYCSTTQRARHTIPWLQDIRTSYPLERVQIDVVNFEFDASQGYKLFLHIKDHFTKLSILYPFIDKYLMGIARHLEESMRYYGTQKLFSVTTERDSRGRLKGFF